MSAMLQKIKYSDVCVVCTVEKREWNTEIDEFVQKLRYGDIQMHVNIEWYHMHSSFPDLNWNKLAEEFTRGE
jgi:hypothetical protein